MVRKDDRLVVTGSQGPFRFYVGTLAPESQARFFNEDDPRGTYLFSTDAETGVTTLVSRDAAGNEIQRVTKPRD